MLGGKPEIVGDASEPNGRTWKPDVRIVRAVIAFAMKGRLAPEGGRRAESESAHVVTQSTMYISYGAVHTS